MSSATRGPTSNISQHEQNKSLAVSSTETSQNVPLLSSPPMTTPLVLKTSSVPVRISSVDQSTTDKTASAYPNGQRNHSTTTPDSGSRSLSALSQNFWLWELVSIIFSVLSLVALIAVLAAYDEKPLGAGNFGLTLNAVISILVSVSEFALVYPVAEALNQRRWMRLRTSPKPRPLTDIQVFDEAARGPWGAVKLLSNGLVFGPLTILGGLMMIMHLFMGPFAQQLVTYPQRSTFYTEPAGYRPYISRAQSYQLNFLTKDKAYTDFFQSATTGLENSFYHNSTTSNFSCRSGNCTWDPFTSLGVCSTCVNVTDMVTMTCDRNQSSSFSVKKPCNVTLRGGFFATNKQSSFTYAAVTSGQFGAINSEYGRLNSLFSWNDTFAPVFGDLMYPIFVTLVRDSDVRPRNVTYNACAMSYCLQTYFNASVQFGTFSRGSTENDVPNGPLAEYPVPKGGWELRPNESYARYSRNRTYVLGATTPASVQGLLASVFSVECPQINANTSVTCPSPYFTNVLDQSWLRSNATSPQTLESFAESVTNSFRNNGGFDGDDDSFAYGNESVTRVYVHVEWGWIAMPCSVVLSSAIFVLFTVIQNSRQRNSVWKSSALALMYHGLADVPDPAPDTVKEMHGCAKKCLVQLEPSSEGSLRLKSN